MQSSVDTEYKPETEEIKWKRCVPQTYWDTVTCYFLKENGSTAYVCTSEGAFLECCDSVIERSCLLKCEKADSILQFFTYHPFMEYFIVKDGKKLTIISNSKDLNIFQIHTDVKKYEIGDYGSQGYPQIKIWPLSTDKQPFIADFSETSPAIGSTSKSHNNDVICSRLQPKLKEANGLLTSYIKDLESKRKLRTDTISRLLNNSSADTNNHSIEMQHFLGSETIKKVSKDKLSISDVCLLYPWQTALDKKWLLGILVKNLGKSVISNFKLIIHGGKKKINYTVKRMNSNNIDEVFNRLELKYKALPPKPAIVWHEEALEEELSPNKGFILITLFPFPDFMATSVITIQGKLSYSLVNHKGKPEGEFYQEYPPFKITARNVLSGSLITESPHTSFFETISAIAVSEAVVLTVYMGMSSTKSIENILIEDIGFSSIHEDNLYSHLGIINHSLSGSIAQTVPISNNIFELRLYARNHELLVLLVYSVLEALPGSWDIKYSGSKSTVFSNDQKTAVTVDQCSEALLKEIMFFVSFLSEWKEKNTDTDICIDVHSYNKFRKLLTSLQEQTDRAFSYCDLERK